MGSGASQSMIPMQVWRMQHGQLTVPGDTASFLAGQAGGTEAQRAAVVNAGAVPALVALLTKDDSVWCPRAKEDAASALKHITAGTEAQRAAVVQAGAVPALVALLQGGSPAAQEQAYLTLSNIAAGSEVCKAAVVQGGAVPALVGLLQGVCPRAKEHAAGALRNIVVGSGAHQAAVVQAGAVPPLKALLQGGSPVAKEHAKVALQCMLAGSEVEAGAESGLVGNQKEDPPTARAHGTEAQHCRTSKTFFVQQKTWTGEVPAADAAVPGYWLSKTPGSASANLTEVSHADAQTIQTMVMSTFKPVATRDRGGKPMPRELRILKVRRNENAALWSRYVGGRCGVRAARPHKCVQLDGVYGGAVVTLTNLPLAMKTELRPGVNECFLWHGTSPSAVDAVCKHGFDLALGRAGSHVGSMFGPGAYFAECSSKADEYASDGEGIYHGLCCLLLCRVVLGEVLMMTNAGDSVHGIVKASMESGAYDSVLGNRAAAVGTYREFVVFQENQIYPEFAIIYERVL